MVGNQEHREASQIRAFPLFDSINEWESFKVALCSKFQDIYTSSDFYKVLYNIHMAFNLI